MAIEYGLIAVAAVTIMGAVGTNLTSALQTVANDLQGSPAEGVSAVGPVVHLARSGIRSTGWVGRGS